MKVGDAHAISVRESRQFQAGDDFLEYLRISCEPKIKESKK